MLMKKKKTVLHIHDATSNSKKSKPKQRKKNLPAQPAYPTARQKKIKKKSIQIHGCCHLSTPIRQEDPFILYLYPFIPPPAM
jgi:hypothetical protein